MKRTKTNNDINISFNSITEVVNYIDTVERTPFYKSIHKSDDYNYNFRGTYSMEEARELLLHGWDDGAKQLKDKLDAKVNVNNTGYKNKTIYDVAGFQCSVPRYLQGVPTNMINNKRVVQKQKVVNITKDFGYSGITSKETMIHESIKFLQAVEKLEQQGVRCNVFVSFVSRNPSANGYIDIRMKVKESSQRMNLKQLAFPLAHPSMFRRITFALIERLEDCKDFGMGYGRCTEWETVKHLYKGEYYVPRNVREEEITDIEKYKVR